MRTATCLLFLDTITGKWRLRTRASQFYRGEIPFKVVVHYDMEPIKTIVLERTVESLAPHVKEGIIEALEKAERGDKEEKHGD